MTRSPNDQQPRAGPGRSFLSRAAALLAPAVGLSVALFPSACRASAPRDHAPAPASARPQSQPLSIPAPGSLQNPAWSPDSSQLLFTRFRGGYNAGPADLMVFRLKDRSVRTLVSDGSDNVNLAGSVWNAATHQIVFSSSREPHDEVFVIGEAGEPGQERRVTSRAGRVAYEPSLSPDGRSMVFESHREDVEGNGVLTSYRIDGTGRYEALTGPGEDCRQPIWSPDGARIAYQARDSGHWDIWTVKPDGTGATRITSGDGDKTDASFSPDGRWIVYSADSSGGTGADLFIIPASGGTSIPVTASRGYEGAPSWSPDGAHIAFESSTSDPDGTSGTAIWVTDVPVH